VRRSIIFTSKYCVNHWLIIDVRQSKAKTQADKEKAAKADDPQAGADSRKIVNLMAGDASSVLLYELDRRGVETHSRLPGRG